MEQAISDLWGSRDQGDWCKALDRYWEHPSVRRNLEIEKFMAKLDSEVVKRLAHSSPTEPASVPSPIKKFGRHGSIGDADFRESHRPRCRE